MQMLKMLIKIKNAYDGKALTDLALWDIIYTDFFKDVTA